MPRFNFTAKNLKGGEIGETREAEDEFALARNLKKEGYILIDFEEEGKKRKSGLSFLQISIGGVPLSEKMIFMRNLAVMISAGLPISRALGVLNKQTKNRTFQKVLSEISANLSKGNSFSDSMAKHPRAFPQLAVAMIKAGEKSGKLDETLKIIASQMEKDYLLRRKIKGAMVYPAIVIIAMIAIAILMLIYVVPTLVSTFEELGVDLPLTTRLVIWFSKSLITNSLLIGSIVLIIVFLSILAFRTKRAKGIISTLLLRLPLFSPLVKKINSARTARTLSSLIGSGVEILEALEITAAVVQNLHYKNVLKEAKIEIQKGSTIALAFKKAEKIYPPLVGEMIEVGEETGQLSDMLLKLAGFYEEEVSEATKDMATVIEPILMILIGVVVGFFALAMLRPMYSMVGGM